MLENKQLALSQLSVVKEQEKYAIFDTFKEQEATTLGQALLIHAQEVVDPVVIDIRTPDRILFHAALPGSTSDNDFWVKRKSNTVFRFHTSSLHMGLKCLHQEEDFNQLYAIPLSEFAAHGGSFPVKTKDSGVVAAITVSGLPQLDDHAFVIDILNLQYGWSLPQLG